MLDRNMTKEIHSVYVFHKTCVCVRAQVCVCSCVCCSDIKQSPNKMQSHFPLIQKEITLVDSCVL